MLQRDWALQADGISRYVFRAISLTGDAVDREVLDRRLAGAVL